MDELLNPCDFGSARYSRSSLHERKQGDGIRSHGDTGTRGRGDTGTRGSVYSEPKANAGVTPCAFTVHLCRSDHVFAPRVAASPRLSVSVFPSTPLLDASTLLCYKKRLRALRIVLHYVRALIPQ